MMEIRESKKIGASVIDLRKSVDNLVTEAQWKMMSEQSGLEPAVLKEKILTQLENFVDQGLADVPYTQSVRILEPSTDLVKDNCKTLSFGIDIFKIVGMSAEITLCGDSSWWTAEVKVCLILAGACVLSRTFTLDPYTLETCLTLEAGVAWARICIGLEQRGNRLDVRTHGKGCYWFFGWNCDTFDVTPVSFPLP